MEKFQEMYLKIWKIKIRGTKLKREFRIFFHLLNDTIVEILFNRFKGADIVNIS